MIQRIVKMEFRPEEINSFIRLFEKYKEQIRSSEGCQSLKLLKGTQDSSIFFTYSIWKDQKYLDQYRNSKLFGEVWKQTKSKFAKRAEAWSTELLHHL